MESGGGGEDLGEVMDSLPDGVRAYVVKLLIDTRNIAYLRIDAGGAVCDAGGSLSLYGLASLRMGASAEDQVGFLRGLLPLPEPSFVLHSLAAEGCACLALHLWQDAQSTWVLFLDATMEHDRVQTMKQIGNELSLHNERQNQVLGAHLGKSIADDLIGGRWHLQSGGERRTLSIVFADIRDFTPFGEQNHPEAVFRTLNQYMPAMLEPIEQFGGTVDKIVGDAVMGVFGLDDAQPQPARQAVRAAQQILRNVDTVRRSRLAQHDVALGVGIGIATGPVAIGVIGTQARHGFTAIGHHVNFAARLQGYAQAGEIYLDADTCRSADVQPLRDVKLSLKGFRDPVQAFVLGAGGAA
mgnify:FL=1